MEKGPRIDYHKEFTYDFSNRLIREDEVHEDGTRLSITHKYNHLSERTSTTDFYGNVTKFHYDECGRLIETKLPNKVVLKTEYNALDQPIATYDGLGNCTTKSFNIRGKPCHVQYPDGSTETFEYTLDGLLERSVATNGVVTLYTYDSLKRVTSQEKLSISGERLSITYSTYNAFHLLSETDEAGYLTEYQYDAAGRLIAATKGDSRTEYIYDSLGRIARTLEYINDHEYRATVKKYDLLDRVVSEQIEDVLGKIFKKEKFAYDADGNVTKTTTFTQAGQADTQTIYNSHQEPLYTIDALGNTTHSVYRYDYYNEEGKCVACQETTDPLGNITIIIKDVNGQTAQILKRNAFGEITQSLKFTRDDNGNCLSQTAFDPERTIVTEWEYDVLNRVIHTTEAVKTPEQKHTRYVYNLFGEKEKTIKPDGTELLYAYDAFGRLSSYKGSGFHYTYQYDLNSNPICVKNLVTNTSTQRAFDVNDRLITEILENDLQLNYFYDRLGRLLTLSLPEHSEINYSYDANHLRKVYRGSYVHYYTDFDLSENLLSASSPIGNLSYGYDLLSRLTALSTPESHDTFAYDAIGNLLEKVTPSETLTYTYDSLYQLTSEPGHTYKYDSHYNRISKDGKRYTLNSLNQILKQDTSQYTYSANGALTKKVQDGETTTYSYDGLDRLIKVAQGDTTTTYHYDAFNRRISKTHNEVTTNYLYHDQNEIGAYVNNALKELRVLGLGQGAEIGAAVFLELSGQTYVPTHDQNGNVTALFLPSGECLEAYRYTAFGEELASTKIGNPWRFSSKRHDPETGFLYFGQRYYAADLGRWITPDPLEFEDGPNLYAYVHNNPLTSIDLYGLFDDDTGYSFSDNNNNGISGCQRTLQDFCDGYNAGYSYAMQPPVDDERRFGFEKKMLGSFSNEVGKAVGIQFGNNERAQIKFSEYYDKLPSWIIGNGNRDITTGELPCPGSILNNLRRVSQVCKNSTYLRNIGNFLYRSIFGTQKTSQTLKNTTPCLDQLSKAGEAIDRGGLTKAGRALEKHGGRLDSVFPKATGNVAKKNLQGQFHLDDILTDPKSEFIQDGTRGFQIYSPSGRGAYFRNDGTFRGFVER